MNQRDEGVRKMHNYALKLSNVMSLFCEFTMFILSANLVLMLIFMLSANLLLMFMFMLSMNYYYLCLCL